MKKKRTIFFITKNIIIKFLENKLIVIFQRVNAVPSAVMMVRFKIIRTFFLYYKNEQIICDLFLIEFPRTLNR